ncbi:hypothetical protein TDB9533_02118 [Thalassocella blandensis]|nr:hypothetical protein TDB9533_02118 [Thalassocella blandensis]
MGIQTVDESHEVSSLAKYFKVWILLFVLSAFSYMVDLFQLQGYLRWTLVLMFMMLKAAFILSVFMHLGLERFALKTLVLLPPGAILVLILFMAVEGQYTTQSREFNFSQLWQQEILDFKDHHSPSE